MYFPCISCVFPMYFLFVLYIYERPTGSHSPSSLWLIRVKPVVKMFPSLVKMALIGRMPSCGARRSYWSTAEQTLRAE